MPPIDVAPETFSAASKIFGQYVAHDLQQSLSRLTSGLQDTAAMAGSDPGGTKWAASYDQAAQTTASGITDLANASTQLAAMLEQTGFNHGLAESSSDPTRSVPTPADMTNYQVGGPSVPGHDIPSAAGGSGSAPNGWGLIESAVGYVWPNGHQDKLRAASSAWSNVATSISSLTVFIPEALQAISSQRSPEVADATTTCNAMQQHLTDVADACNGIAKGCSDFAGYIDTAHSDVEHELTSLVEWTVGIEAGGAILGFFTAGISEAAAQAAEATRIAATATRVGNIIAHLVELAGTVAETIGNVVTKVADVCRSLKAILGARLSAITASLVEKLPALGKTAEVVAEDGLATAAESSKTDDALYQAYVKRKEAGGLKPLARDAWQKKLDTLRLNKLNGDAYEAKVADDLGIKIGEGGWTKQLTLKDLGRRFDIAREHPPTAIEVKSGTTPVKEGLEQISKDEQAVRKGWNVTWYMKKDLDPRLMERLQELSQKYPGRFNFTVAGK